MARVAVIGKEEFVVGFQLSGIRDIIKVSDSKDNAINQIKSLMKNKDFGIIIIEEGIVNNLDFHDRMDIENSINPVFVQLSTEATQDSLRKLIIKSIGVDLWTME